MPSTRESYRICSLTVGKSCRTTSQQVHEVRADVLTQLWSHVILFASTSGAMTLSPGDTYSILLCLPAKWFCWSEMQKPPRSSARHQKNNYGCIVKRPASGEHQRTNGLSDGKSGRSFSRKASLSLHILIKAYSKMPVAESNRDWHFGFNDYYDVYIWDLEPGQDRACLYNVVFEVIVLPFSNHWR